jgi:predicted MPP superfamily phosphohydrolase
MKILTVGDVHGMDSWKRISPGNYDLIVFVGDYVDSFTVSDEVMMNNFHEIVMFKKAWPDKVVLLLGNHDIGYIYPRFTCSGYRYTIENEVRALYKENAHLFRIAFQWEHYLWTHAGIHQGYYEKHILPKVLESDQNLADTLQRLFNERYEPLFEVGYERGGMRNDIGGPFWIDRTARSTSQRRR